MVLDRRDPRPTQPMPTPNMSGLDTLRYTAPLRLGPDSPFFIGETAGFFEAIVADLSRFGNSDIAGRNDLITVLRSSQSPELSGHIFHLDNRFVIQLKDPLSSMGLDITLIKGRDAHKRVYREIHLETRHSGESNGGKTGFGLSINIKDGMGGAHIRLYKSLGKHRDEVFQSVGYVPADMFI